MADKRTLSWLLDFIYQNLQEMPPEAFHAMASELNRLLGSPFANVWMMDESCLREQVAELQRGLRSFLDTKLIPEIESAEAVFSSEGHRETITEGRGKIHKGVEIPTNWPTIHFELQLRPMLVSDVLVMIGQLDNSGGHFRRHPVGGFESAKIKTKVTTGFDINGLLLHFLLALDELPASDLGRCRAQGCERWFLRVTRRSRDYCSPRCASRYGQFLRRQRLLGDPESCNKYRESAKERAAKSYEKKVRAENPRAKIKKRGV
jgi:hypothetical protein